MPEKESFVSEEMIKELKKIDTPTLSNALELLELRNRMLGFCNREIKCLFPELGVMCGFAVTAKVQTMHPDYGTLDKKFIDLCKSMESSHKPRVVVFQEVTPHPEFSAHCGMVMGTAFKRLNAEGVVSDSAVRDMEDVKNIGLKYFAPGCVGSHANFRIVETQVPVTVGGLNINPADILHGDENGLIKVPKEGVEKLPSLAEEILSNEKKIIEFINSPDFNLDDLGKMLTH